MNALTSDRALLLRALNANRQSYFPTYVGLRLLANQISPKQDEYLRRTVARRLAAGDRWNFRRFQYFKTMNQTSSGETPEYRSCLAPSPLTAFTESFILAHLASMPNFKAPSRAYSYLWPSSTWSGSNYQYFAEGYRQRNQEIGVALESPGSVAIVTDLKAFYPSVRYDRVIKELTKRLQEGRLGRGPSGTEIGNFYSQMFDAGSGGLPIGPASAHALGHLALAGIDEELTAAYGMSYFRYVDDIIVVCHRGAEEDTKRRIASCVGSHGYTLNAEKSLVLNGADWSSNVLSLDTAGPDEFRTYARDLATYLAFHPGRAKALGEMLSDAGLSIPVQRLQALSSYSRFRYFLGKRKAQGGLSHALGVALADNADLVARAISLKRDYEKALEELLRTHASRGAESRRWHVQRMRRVINTLFYLRRFDEWRHLAETFKTVPELVEQRALAEALVAGTVNSILPFYPRGPAAFAELWSEHGRGFAKVEPSKGLQTIAAVDSLATLSLTGAIAQSLISTFPDDEKHRLLRIVGASDVRSRSRPDLSYEDEIESLRLGVTHDEISVLARSRYGLSEGATLDVLSLLTSEYLS